MSTRIIKSSGRTVQTVERPDGFFVCSEAPRQQMLEHLYGPSVSGPYPSDDNRFTSAEADNDA